MKLKCSIDCCYDNQPLSSLPVSVAFRTDFFGDLDCDKNKLLPPLASNTAALPTEWQTLCHQRCVINFINKKKIVWRVLFTFKFDAHKIIVLLNKYCNSAFVCTWLIQKCCRWVHLCLKEGPFDCLQPHILSKTGASRRKPSHGSYQISSVMHLEKGRNHWRKAPSLKLTS